MKRGLFVGTAREATACTREPATVSFSFSDDEEYVER